MNEQDLEKVIFCKILGGTPTIETKITKRNLSGKNRKSVVKKFQCFF